MDKSSNINGIEVVIVLTSLSRQTFKHKLYFELFYFNNVEEYKALLGSLNLVESFDVYPFHVYNDSQLIIG